MKHRDLILDLEQALAELPMFDVHTHLVGGKLGARGLARYPALSHGRQRPLCGRMSERRAADTVSGLSGPARKPMPGWPRRFRICP